MWQVLTENAGHNGAGVHLSNTHRSFVLLAHHPLCQLGGCGGAPRLCHPACPRLALLFILRFRHKKSLRQYMEWEVEQEAACAVHMVHECTPPTSSTQLASDIARVA